MNEDNKNIQAEETEQITESTSNQKSLTKTIIEFLSVIATSIVAIMFIFTFVFIRHYPPRIYYFIIMWVFFC